MNLQNEAVQPTANLRLRRMTWLSIVVFTLITSTALPTLAATGRYISHNTPTYVSKAKNLGNRESVEDDRG